MFCTTYYSALVGSLILASNGHYLVGLWMKDQKYYAATISEKMTKKANLPIFEVVKKWLNDYFNNKNPAILNLPLAPSGSKFRQLVWKELCEIPYGQVSTYGAIAKKIAFQKGQKSISSQAIGGAVSHNPISVIIPCHRVIGSDGRLTGYAGGIDKKIKLLEHEGQIYSRL